MILVPYKLFIYYNILLVSKTNKNILIMPIVADKVAVYKQCMPVMAYPITSCNPDSRLILIPESKADSNS